MQFWLLNHYKTLFMLPLTLLYFYIFPALTSANTPLKISVNQDGIYRITYDDLVNAGIKVPRVIDPKGIKLFNKGEEIAIYVKGEENDIFDIADVL